MRGANLPATQLLPHKRQPAKREHRGFVKGKTIQVDRLTTALFIARQKRFPQLFGGDATWQLISKHEMTVDGLQNKPYRLRIDIWYQERPAPMILPQTIDAPCGGA